MADQETLKKIKAALNIVDVIGEQVALKKSGSKLKGLSPFNEEKTPSFFVDPAMQSFYCFSTNQGGDIFDFLKLTKGMSFPEAVDYLAKKAGIKVQKNFTPEQAEKEKKAQEERTILIKINRFAAHFYQSQLNGPLGAEARAYAERRALTKPIQEAYGLGLATDSWSALRDYFISIKAPLKHAVTLGLLRARNDETPREDGANLYDTFRNRLLFPIRDVDGEIVGFGGRWLGSSSEESAKYINSPESPIYNKGKMFYNLDRARKHIREKETVVLVEGYMDCIALDQAGFHYTVATLGTALTPQHVQTLRKLAPRIISLYDSDVAGQRATERNMNMFLEEAGFPLLGAFLPEGKDPDEFLRTNGGDGVKALENILENAPALIDLWIGKRLSSAPKTLQGRTETLEKIAEKIAYLNDEIAVQARIPEVAAKLGFSEDLVMASAQRARRKLQGGAQEGSIPAKSMPIPQSPNTIKNATKNEKARKNSQVNGKREFGFGRRFLSDVIKYPDWIPALRKIHNEDPGTIIPNLADQELVQAMQLLLAPLASGEEEQNKIEQLLEFAREKTELRNFIAEAILQRNAEPSPEGLLKDALQRLRKETLQRKKQNLLVQISEAEASGDLQACEQLQRELNQIIRAIKENY